MKYTPHEYQQFCIDYLLDHPAAGLFLKPGMGPDGGGPAVV